MVSDNVSRSAGIAVLPRAAGALQGKGGEEVKRGYPGGGLEAGSILGSNPLNVYGPVLRMDRNSELVLGRKAELR